MKADQTERIEQRQHVSNSLQCVLLAIVATLPAAAQSGKPQDTACKPGSKAAACQQAPAVPASDTPTAKPPASAADFAFPVEDSKHGTDPDGTPHTPDNSSHVPDTTRPGTRLPDMPTGDVPDPPASSERPLGGSGAGSSSSSSDGLPPGTSSSAAPGDVDEDVAPTTPSPRAPIKSARLKDLGSRGDSSAAREKLEQTRVADDLKVGLFYTKDGNTQGAYLRFKDAAERAPDDPDVRFYLAESANKLNKREEAVLNYRACLQADPGGDHDKAARKALSKLGVTAP